MLSEYKSIYLRDKSSALSERTIPETTTEITYKDTTAAVNDEPNENLETAKVFQAYEQEIGVLTAFVREEVLDAIERYPHDWIIEAIKEAAKNNARKWSYARAILESWKVNGYKTDVRSKKQNGKSKQGGSKSYISPGLQKMLEEEKAERMRLYGGDDDE
jgi:DnaD/phage-associated family protein